MFCLNKQKNQISNYDPYKADIYGLGMLMIEVINLDSL